MKTFYLILFLLGFISLRTVGQTGNCIFKPPAVTIHFGTGDIGEVNSISLDNYDRVSTSCPSDGHYTYTSYTSDCFRGDWHTLSEDHTPGDVNGNMLLVNASYNSGAFFRTAIRGLKGGSIYEFGVWLMNVCRISDKCPFPLLPNIIIRLQTPAGKTVAQFGTGEVVRREAPYWTQYRAIFTMPASETSLFVTMMDNAPGGCGNDFALDDITLRECIKQPPVTTVAPKVPVVVKKQPQIITPDKPQTLVKSLVAGTYSFELKVTDNGGLSGKDTVQVTVLSEQNASPFANAGQDQSITLPTNSVTLTGSGTDTDGSIATYGWTEVAGPVQGSITSPNAATTTVTGLVEGSYIFRLTVTDNKGATASDDVAVTVNSAPVVVTTKYINVNIYGGTNAYNNNAWNNWNIRTKTVKNVTSSKFKYSDGTSSAISATLSNSTDIADNGSNYGSGMAPAPVLRYTSYYTGTRTLTLKGLSASKKYNIELYASRNVSGSSNIFTINGASQTIATYNNLITKAVFNDLSPSSTGQLVISIATSGSFNCINGFAITENAAATTSTIKTGALQQVLTEEETPAPGTSLEVFPNPANQNLTLKVLNSHVGTLTVQIVSAAGRVIKTLQLTKGQQLGTYAIPVNELNAGLYLIQLQLDDWHATKRFVKL